MREEGRRRNVGCTLDTERLSYHETAQPIRGKDFARAWREGEGEEVIVLGVA